MLLVAATSLILIPAKIEYSGSLLDLFEGQEEEGFSELVGWAVDLEEKGLEGWHTSISSATKIKNKKEYFFHIFKERLALVFLTLSKRATTAVNLDPIIC